MKKPTLRFRQVFEHPTHFKVTKPLGNPLLIAKKGLSPNLMGRLRKYAEGTPDEPVQPPTEQERQTALALQDEGVGVERITAKPWSITPPSEYITETEPTSYAGVEPALEPAPVPVTMPAAPEPVAAPVAKPVEPAPIAEPVAEEPPAEEPLAEEPTKPAAEEPVAEETPKVEAVEPAKPSPLLDALGQLNITQDQLVKMSPMQRTTALAAAKQIMAREELAKIDLAAADAEAGVLQSKMGEQAKELERLNKRADEARGYQQRILEKMDYLDKPSDYFSSLGTLQQIGSALSVAMGAFASGMTGMPNFALKIYENAVERDLAQQRQREDSLRNRLVAAGHTAEGADELVRAQMKLIAASQAGIQAANVKLPQVKAKIQAEQAKMVSDAVAQMARVAQQERSAGAQEQIAAERKAEGKRREAKAPFELRRAEAEAQLAEGDVEGLPTKKAKLAAEAEAAALRPQQMRLDMLALKKRIRMDEEKFDYEREQDEKDREERLAKTRDEKEKDRIARELTIGDINLELKDDKRAQVIRDDISQRQQAITSARKLDALLQQTKEGFDLWRPGSDTRNEAIAELNTLIENYPKGAGFKRAISVNAKDVLTKAIQDPTSYKTLLKDIFLDKDPAIGVRTVLEEFQRNLEQQVKSMVRNPNDPIVDKALQSYYKQSDQLIEKYKKSTVADDALLRKE